MPEGAGTQKHSPAPRGRGGACASSARLVADGRSEALGSTEEDKDGDRGERRACQQRHPVCGEGCTSGGTCVVGESSQGSPCTSPILPEL